MNVCVLQPSYEKSELLKEYATHDPPRDLSALVPEWSFTHVLLNKATVYSQLKDLKREGFDIFVNLCEGHLDWDVPSIDVVHALDSLGLPYTGPGADRYETRKEMLKIVARYAQVHTPPHVLARTADDVATAAESLRFPLFVKPGEGGDSFGVDEASLCQDAQALASKSIALLRRYDSILIEEYLEGREFSVLVAMDSANPKTPLAFRPVEYRFPPGERFKTYDLKNAQYHPEANVAVDDPVLETTLIEAARRVFLTFGGGGYSRMDFRLTPENVPSVVDANFTCSVFYPEGFYGTADYILQLDGFGASNFLRHIVKEGLERFKSLQKPYAVRTKNGGLGIDAVRAISRGEVVFNGEGRSQRVVTRRWVEEHWDARDRRTFAQYAYPLSDEVYILWSENPLEWAPQNHSCNANCHYDGLNVVALRNIRAGEELTLDYAQFCNELSAGFDCHCGAAKCRGFIVGTPGTGVDAREKARRRVRTRPTTRVRSAVRTS
jgi:D-alanine-D-alanine ligase-like ATP-grasp enzyme